MDKTNQPQNHSAHMMHNLEPTKKGTKVTVNMGAILVGLGIIIAGVLTGTVLAGKGSTSSAGQPAAQGVSTTNGGGKVVGVADEKTFKDSAEGTLTAGGTDSGEGTHHLERPGGPSQNVYLTSSTIPLDDYVGKKVKVWGQTFSAKSAGWLMDVGRLEVE